MSRERLLEGSALLTEALWYFAFCSALVPWFTEGEGPPFWTVLAAAVGGFYMARLLEHFDLSLDVLRVVGLVISTLGLYVLLRIAYLDNANVFDLSWLSHFGAHPGTARTQVVFGSLLTAIFWLRWAIQGQGRLTFDGVAASFSIGFVLIIVAALADIGADLEAGVSVVMVPFFAIGLLTMALFRLNQTGVEAPIQFNRPWVLASLSVILLLVLLAAPAWLVGGVDAGPALEPPGDAIGWTLDRIFFVLAIPLGYFFDFMYWILSKIIGDDVLERPQIVETLEEATDQDGENKPPFPLVLLMRMGAALFMAAVLAGLAWLILSNFGKRQRRAAELRESVWQEGNLIEDVSDLLVRLLARTPRPHVHPSDLPADLMAVRRLYLDVLNKAEDRGLERPPAKTPHEFAPPLREHFRSKAPDEVSRAFARARYGLKLTPPSELERLRKAWREANK